jgi:hypothetical protein
VKGTPGCSVEGPEGRRRYEGLYRRQRAIERREGRRDRGLLSKQRAVERIEGRRGARGL